VSNIEQSLTVERAMVTPSQPTKRLLSAALDAT
jgi:hypothetical protein